MKPKNIAYLKSLANALSPSVTVGKGAIDDRLIQSVENALKAHELIKVRVLSSSEYSRDEIGPMLAKATSSVHVSTIGRIVTLYKAKKDPKIILPYLE